MKDTKHTKEHIIKQARLLFSKRGFDATSMADIAKKVGIEKASLYYFFKDKEALFAAVMEDVWCRLLEDIEQLGREPDSAERVSTNVLAHIIRANLQSGIAVGMAMPASIARHKSFKKAFRYIAESRRMLRAFLEYEKVPEPEIAEEFIVNAVYGYVVNAQHKKPAVPPERYAEYISSLVFKSH